MVTSNLIAKRIYEYRMKQNMSVQELADLSKTSTQLIEALESGKQVPSLTPLLNIARALGCRLGSFLDDQVAAGPIIVKKGKHEGVARFAGSNTGSNPSELSFHALAGDKTDRHMEPFLIDVKPLHGEYTLSTHEGEEFIYVLDGTIEIQYGASKYVLSSGDSIYYDSVVPHHLHGIGSDAKILAVIYAPF